MSNFRRRVFEILEPPTEGDAASRAFDVFILALIFLNVLGIVVESLPTFPDSSRRLLRIFEIVSVAVFTIEYALRMWTCTLNARYRRPVIGRLRFAFSFMALIDLAAILPFYLPMLIAVDLRYLRALRLFRFARVVKMGRYSRSLRLIRGAIAASKADLINTAFAACVLLVIASSMMYYAEHNAQPDVFSSIPATMWWGVITLTTVGYGDALPVTPIGKLIACFAALMGIGLFALPTAILGSAFLEQARVARQEDFTCPHCGKTLRREG